VGESQIFSSSCVSKLWALKGKSRASARGGRHFKFVVVEAKIIFCIEGCVNAKRVQATSLKQQ